MTIRNRYNISGLKTVLREPSFRGRFSQPSYEIFKVHTEELDSCNIASLFVDNTLHNNFYLVSY